MASPIVSDPTHLLVIYLQDHDAASQAGHALARRCAASNTDTELGRYLVDRFLPELDDERATLVEVLAAVGAGPCQFKRLALRAGEIAGRLKPNGRVRSYSPLSRVIELEALVAGVNAKLRLWVVVETVAGTAEHPSMPDVSLHLERAKAQLADLQRHHQKALETAFVAQPQARVTG